MLPFFAAKHIRTVLSLAISVVLLLWFIGTLIGSQPTEPSPPPALSASTLQGVWQVAGDPIGLNRGPLSQDWFALVPRTANQVRLVWMRDGWCSQLDTRIFGRELHIVSDQPRVIVAFETDASATATVYQGDHQWTQHYVKQRTTVPACDWLLQ